jgi:hypothetical protein
MSEQAEPRSVPALVVVAGGLLILHAVAWLLLLFAAAGVGGGLYPTALEFSLLIALAVMLPAGVGIILGARWGVIAFGLSTAVAFGSVAASMAMTPFDLVLDAETVIFLGLFVGIPVVTAVVLVRHRQLFWPR